jgi:ElaA protein
MNIICKTFQELNTLELYKIIQLRVEVFSIEQECAYQDLDNKDLLAQHLMFWDKDILAAYCRLLDNGISYEGYSSIGRVVVKDTHRKLGLGIQLMQDAIVKCKEDYGLGIKISAQEYLHKFYCDLGFITYGDGYLEDNIPHLPMKLEYKPIVNE